MFDDPVLFRARAVAEQENADAATLGNVRDRSQRAADSWAKMADRAERTNALRARREAGDGAPAASPPLPKLD